MNLPKGLVEALNRETDVAYVIDVSGRIEWLNPAWDQCAARDRAPERVLARNVLGSAWLDAVHGPARGFYARVLSQLRTMPRTTRPTAIVHAGECNTPELFRRISTRFVPLFSEASPAAVAVLAITSTVSIEAIDARYTVEVRPTGEFRHDNGIVAQCGCCRRVMHPRTATWTYVPELVERPDENTSHGLCNSCLETYYGDPIVDG